MDISVAPNNCASLNHMNRKQFYSALKLIAAHQTNMSLKPDLLSTPLDLPLPRFTWALNSEASADLIQLSSSPKEQHIPKRERNFGGNLGAYEPIRVSSNLSDSDGPPAMSHDATEGLSTDSEMESETMSQRSGSHGVSSSILHFIHTYGPYITNNKTVHFDHNIFYYLCTLFFKFHN